MTAAGPCLADPGREYVVYVEQAEPFAVTLTGLAGPLPTQWFQPLSGERENVAALNNGTTDMTPPAGWEGKPAALHLGVKRD